MKPAVLAERKKRKLSHDSVKKSCVMEIRKRSCVLHDRHVVGEIVSFNRATAFNVFRDINEKVFSPVSLLYIKAMARAAVQDEHQKTQIMDMKMGMFEELESAMTESFLNMGMASLICAMNTYGPNFVLSMKNNIFYKNSERLPEKYLTLCNALYDLRDRQLNLLQNVSITTHSDINRWISEESRGTITDIISKSNFDECTDFLLVNCVYFSGEWALDLTTLDFNRNLRNFTSETLGCTFIEVPFKHGEFSMVFMYPNDWDTCRELFNSLSDLFHVIMGGMLNEFEIELELPEGVFQSDARFQHLQTLKECDGTSVINSVTQKVYMEITKKGTKAAAVTVLNQSVPEVEAKKVVQNEFEPIIFVLYDKDEEVILFVGSNAQN